MNFDTRIYHINWELGVPSLLQGEAGQHSLDNHKDVDQAIKAFKKKFKDKTKNDWDKRDNFNDHPGKYTMIDIGECIYLVVFT